MRNWLPAPLNAQRASPSIGELVLAQLGARGTWLLLAWLSPRLAEVESHGGLG